MPEYKNRQIGSAIEEDPSPIDVFAIAPAISTNGCRSWTRMRQQFEQKAMQRYRRESPQASTLNFMEAAMQGNKRLRGLDTRASQVMQYELEAIKYILLREDYVKKLRETYLCLNHMCTRHLKVQEVCHQQPSELQSDENAELMAIARASEPALLTSGSAVGESSLSKPTQSVDVSIPVRRQAKKGQSFAPSIKSALDDLAILLRQTRFASICVVEALTKWRSQLPGDRLLAKRIPAIQSIGFLWKNVNYLCKMRVDLEFLDRMVAARDLLGLQASNNPLLLPSAINEVDSLHQDLLKDRAYYDRALRADEVLRREREAENERARRGVHYSPMNVFQILECRLRSQQLQQRLFPR